MFPRFRPVLRWLAIAAGAAAGAAAGCGAPAQPAAIEPHTPELDRDRGPAAPLELQTRSAPTSIAVIDRTLLWTDVAGGIWAMPASGGGEPVPLSDQKTPEFAFHLLEAGRTLFATSRGDLLRVGVPGGPVVRAKLALPEYPVASAADDAHIYLTLFKRPEILRVPVQGGAPRKLAELPRAILALRGRTLYAASYATGALVAIATETGAQRVIARGLAKPTSIAADDTHVYVYTERDETLRRIDAASGAMQTLATGLVNSDDLELDGDHVYTRTWGKRPALVRVAKDGSRPVQTLVELPAPVDIAIDDAAIYVASRDGEKVVRIEKASLEP